MAEAWFDKFLGRPHRSHPAPKKTPKAKPKAKPKPKKPAEQAPVEYLRDYFSGNATRRRLKKEGLD